MGVDCVAAQRGHILVYRSLLGSGQKADFQSGCYWSCGSTFIRRTGHRFVELSVIESRSQTKRLAITKVQRGKRLVCPHAINVLIHRQSRGSVWASSPSPS